jgi:hypothetical protein
MLLTTTVPLHAQWKRPDFVQGMKQAKRKPSFFSDAKIYD